MSKTKQKLPSNRDFIRSQPVTSRAADVVAAAKKAGLTLTNKQVWKEQHEMRKRAALANPSPAVKAFIDREAQHQTELKNLFENGMSASLAQLQETTDIINAKVARGDFGALINAAVRDPKRDSRSFEAIGTVCEALAPLDQADGERVLQAAAIMLGWKR